MHRGALTLLELQVEVVFPEFFQDLLAFRHELLGRHLYKERELEQTKCYFQLAHPST